MTEPLETSILCIAVCIADRNASIRYSTPYSRIFS